MPTPVVSDGLVYITNAHGPASPVYAIKETAAGDISLKADSTSNDRVAWSAARSGGYMCTPLVYRGLVYVVRYNGVLNVFDAKTGEKKYETQARPARRRRSPRPRSPTTARSTSPARTARSMSSRQVRNTRQIAMNEMATPVLATPAISEGRLLLRTQDQLMAIGKK